MTPSAKMRQERRPINLAVCLAKNRKKLLTADDADFTDYKEKLAIQAELTTDGHGWTRIKNRKAGRVAPRAPAYAGGHRRRAEDCPPYLELTKTRNQCSSVVEPQF